MTSIISAALRQVGADLSIRSEAAVSRGYQIIPGMVISLWATGYFVASGNFQVRLSNWATGGVSRGSGHFEYVDLELGVVVVTLPVLQRCQTEAQFRHKSGSARFLRSGASRHLIIDGQEMSRRLQTLAMIIKEGWEANKERIAMLLSSTTTCRRTLAGAVKHVVTNTATVSDLRILLPYAVHANDVYDIPIAENDQVDFGLMSCSLSYEKA